jgi:cytochrome c biogenesis protein CcmG/thiol:disulfide interchange protein DsbE
MSSGMPAPSAKSGNGLRLVHLLPLGFFACLALIFLVRLQSGVDPQAIPSALVGHSAPAFDLPPLDGLGVPGVKRADLEGKVTIVNVFASWCVPCRQEHPVLAALAKEFGGTDGRVRLVGIDYKDQPDNARAFLGEVGNPYTEIGVDQKGRAAIDWGVYGVPETFVVGPDGVIRHKFIGPLTADQVDSVLKPLIQEALKPS